MQFTKIDDRVDGKFTQACFHRRTGESYQETSPQKALSPDSIIGNSTKDQIGLCCINSFRDNEGKLLNSFYEASMTLISKYYEELKILDQYHL
jgi:hypothetical protein